MKYCAMVLICILSLGGLFSCGLEAFYYIDYIPPGVYNDTNAVINLPSPTRDNGYDKDYGYFDNFIIFYRIYISGLNIPTGRYLMDDSNTRSNINSTLNADYVYLDNYTDTASTNVNTSNLENTFCNNRKYSLLTLEGANMNNVLDSGSLGQRLEIAFPPNPGTRPTLTINGAAYVLWRAVENQNLNPPLNFRPQPNRDFLNHPDLYNNANVTNEFNADTATISGSEPRYTYIMMYIAARGTSLEMPPRTIYSQPTFIGIFRLAEW